MHITLVVLLLIMALFSVLKYIDRLSTSTRSGDQRMADFFVMVGAVGTTVASAIVLLG